MSEHPYIKVEEVMSPKVYTIAAKATVREAVEMMRANGVSSLVVERRDEQDEFGMLVVADIARGVIAENASPDRVNVYEIMSKPVLTVAAEMDIRYAVRLLVRFALSRAVVIDHDRRPVGIVTLRDMVLSHDAAADTA
ncbi:MAG: CBS domain-containing protein [Rhodospirillales bacterium]|nr:CBS domain-containing protein [Rhodospirillales bacterium]